MNIWMNILRVKRKSTIQVFFVAILAPVSAQLIWTSDWDQNSGSGSLWTERKDSAKRLIQKVKSLIINYVTKDLICKQITMGISFDKCITIELQVNNNCKLYLATIYRSPNTLVENDKAILEFIDTFGSRNTGYKLLLGDFNCPNIKWDTWEVLVLLK